MPLLKQVGGQRKLYTLRYWTSDGRAYELTFNPDESSESEDVLEAFELYARLEPQAAAALGAKATDSVNRVTAGWRSLLGPRLEPLRRLAQSAQLDLVEELLERDRARVDFSQPTAQVRARLDALADALARVESAHGEWPQAVRFALQESLAYERGDGRDHDAVELVGWAARRLDANPGPLGIFFAHAAEQVDLVEYLVRHCGAQIEPLVGRTSGEGRCPFHEDANPSLKLSVPPPSQTPDPRRASWHCHGGCQASGLDHGDLFDAVRKREGLASREQALARVDELYELGLPLETLVATPELGEDDRQALAAAALADFLAQRRLSPATLAGFGVEARSDLRLHIPLDVGAGLYRGMLTRALIDTAQCRVCQQSISAREWARRVNEAGRRQEAAGRSGRRVEASLPRHCPRCGASPQESGLGVLDGQFPRFQRTLTHDSSRNHGYSGLYNLTAAASALADLSDRPAPTLAERALWLVESHSDVWALAECGIQAAVAYNGARPNEEQLEQVLQLIDGGAPLVLAPPLSREGANGASHILAQIAKRTPRPVYLLDLAPLRAYSVAAVPALADGRVEFDLAGALALAGSEALGAYLAAADSYVDDVVWRVQLILKTRGRDGQPIQSEAQEERSLQSLIGQAGYRPDVARLETLVGRARPRWSQERVSEFVSAAVGQGADARYADERTEWIAGQGSDDLRYALARGYDVDELYLQERAEQELGPGAFVDRQASAAVGARNHPTRAALQLERALPARLAGYGQRVEPEQLRIVYLSEQKREAVRVAGYLGLYYAYLPVAVEPAAVA